MELEELFDKFEVNSSQKQEILEEISLLSKDFLEHLHDGVVDIKSNEAFGTVEYSCMRLIKNCITALIDEDKDKDEEQYIGFVNILIIASVIIFLLRPPNIIQAKENVEYLISNDLDRLIKKINLGEAPSMFYEKEEE